MRLEPRSGQNSPEPTSRKCGATISRSSCWSLLLASANTAQSPLESVVVGLDLDAPHDAVGSGRGRHLEVLALVAIDLDGAGQVERDVVARDLDRLDGRRAGGGKQRRDHRQGERQNCPAAQRKLQRVRSCFGSPGLLPAIRA